MIFLRQLYKQKPRQWGPVSAVRAAVQKWSRDHGLPAPVLCLPCWEKTGSVVHDLSPNGYDILLSGGFSWANSGIKFDGTGYGESDSISQPIGSFGLFIAASSSADNSSHFLFSTRSEDVSVLRGSPGVAHLNADDYQTLYYNDENAIEREPIGSLQSCYTLGGTRDELSLQAYCDGVKSDTISDYSAGSAIITEFYLAARPGGDRCFVGQIDFVGLFDQPVSDEIHWELAENPFGMIQPKSFPIYFIAVGIEPIILSGEGAYVSAVCQTGAIEQNHYLSAENSYIQPYAGPGEIAQSHLLSTADSYISAVCGITGDITQRHYLTAVSSKVLVAVETGQGFPGYTVEGIVEITFNTPKSALVYFNTPKKPTITFQE